MGKSGGSSKADTAVKLVLLFFLSLLSFSVGTYVGKQVSDSDHKTASLENGKQGGHAEQASESEHGDDVAVIEDEKVKSLQDEFENHSREVASTGNEDSHGSNSDSHDAGHGEKSEDQGHAAVAANKGHEDKGHDGYKAVTKMKAEQNEKESEGSHETPADHGSEKAHSDRATAAVKTKTHSDEMKPSSAAKRVANDLAPTADKKPGPQYPKELPPVASTAVGKFTVQVAAYLTEGEADDHAERLRSKGFPAFVASANVKGKTYYRVSLGRFQDQKSAMNYQTELIETKVVTAGIVQKLIAE
jgi:cell division septation protein DedD